MILKGLPKFILIFLLLLYPLYAETPKNIILEAKGQGETERQAINKALEGLSQQIYVSVSNQNISTEKLTNDKFSTSFENNSIISSSGYFQNISVYDKKNSKKYGLEVTVGLSPESISSTIDYLFLQLKKDQVDFLSKNQLKEQLNISNFLFSLTSYAKINNISYNNSSISLKDYITDLNKILSSDSVIKFVIHRENIDVSINIEGKSYSPYKNIYLPKGKYFYEVKAKGYKTIQNSIELYKGDNINIDIYLQKQLKSSIPIKLNMINKTSISNDIFLSDFSSLISNNQMKQDAKSKNYIEFQVTETSSPSIISGYHNNTFNVNIVSYINGIEKRDVFSVNILSKENTKGIFQDNLIHQINSKVRIFFSRLFD